MDNQVKIRGYRIELGEIESLLSQHPAIQAAHAIACKDDSGHNQLVAYVVFDSETLTNTQIRGFLKEKLPAYMIPSAFVVLSSLPLTVNGKVDQSALKKFTITNLDRPFIAPQTSTQATLARLWAKVLKLEQVSIKDSFFELGGDSLLAVELLEQVNQQFKQMPLTDLFTAPTVEQFALLIDKCQDSHNPDASLAWSPLVPLQPAGDKPPFFCVHPVFGVVLPYYELACHLENQPFYALQPYGIDGLHSPLTSIEEMAERYVTALRTVQPQGPYQLGGWSFGGLMAYEMAQQLHRAGELVCLLAILDTLAPVSGNQISVYDGLKFLLTTVSCSIYPFFLDYLSLISDRLLKNANSTLIQRIITPGLWQSLWEKATISHLLPQSTVLRMLDELTIHRMLKIFSANSRAAVKYVPQPYPNAIALFKTSTLLKKSDNLTLGWNQLASNVQVNCISGNHLTMLRKPYVQVLAQQLRSYLASENIK